MDFNQNIGVDMGKGESFTPKAITGTLTIRGWGDLFKKLRNYTIRKAYRNEWKSRSRVRQIDRATYLLWKSEKRKGKLVIPWKIIMRSRRIARKIMKSRQVIFRGH